MAGVLDALASYIQNMLMEMAKEEVHMLLGVSGEIDNMDIKLRDLKNFLADADRRNITDQSVQAFVRELRDTMYDASDILDMCQLKAMEQGQRHDAGCFNPLLFCIQNPLHAHSIGSRIKNLNKKLDDIKARGESFNFINLGTYKDRGRKMVPSSLGAHQTSWALDETGLVGEMIEEDTKNIVELLMKEDQTHRPYNRIMVFAIVGVGGIGKTTLAKKIFKNDIIQQEFSKKIWLSVNQDFNELDILRRAITEAGGDYHVAGDTKATLERILIQALMGHKTLIIMDDVWDYRAWVDVLQTPMVNVATADNGSRVLVTTRHNTVARGMMAEEPYHHIRKLEPEDAWLLLKKQVVVNINDEPQVEMLKGIGMEIIAKCDCLPLAVKVIGGLLRQKTTRQDDWEKVLHDSIWSVSQIPEELNNAIYLSYEDLHPNLKPCFLYYCILPRSKVFDRNDIIGLWISEGFVYGNSCDLEEKGREYYDELIQRNLIEPDMKYVDQLVCSMHHIVRSFAQYVTRDEALVCHNNDIYILGKLKLEKFIRLSIEKEGSKAQDFEWCSLQKQKSLRTLISIGPIMIKPGDSLAYFSSLRTLCLASVNIDKLGESLYQLKHLRYLSIENSETSVLTENIGKLKFLQYINLIGCKSLVKLPSSIGMLQHMRHLNIRWTGINTVPKGFCGSTCLTNLQGFPAHMNGDWCSLEELGPLSQLMTISITFLENVASASFAKQARLGEKSRLRFLGMNCTRRPQNDELLRNVEARISEEEQRRIGEVFDELCPPPCIENIDIIGYFGQQLPRWMMPTTVMPLGSLRILTMDDLPCCTELPSGLSQLPCLELIQIIRAPAIKCVRLEFLQQNNKVGVAFPRLQKLNLNGLVEWEEWEWEEQVKAMPILEKFVLSACKLSHIPPGLALHARALKEFMIHNVKTLSSLENFTSVVRLELFRNTNLERISNLQKLQKLVIIGCPKLKVLEGMPALQRLDVQDYDMETFPTYLQDVSPRHLLLECSIWLLTCIAAGKSSPEWHKFSHIQQVKAYAHDEDSPRKWYVIYTRYPFHFETKISRFAVSTAHNRRNIGSRIKNLNKKLDGIKAHSESFNFINLGNYEDRGRKMVSYSLRTHETSWGLDETGFVGEMIEEDTKNLVELLTKEDQTHRQYNKIMVFAIVGVGGIGKTTLARKIFKNDIVQQEFSKKIWLSVNQDFDELDILRRAITEVGGDYHVAGNEKATLERILTQALMGHKTLFVMDDVWDYRAWVDVLQTPLVNVAATDNGSCVLVTTRHNAVAQGMMAEEPYHRIRKLELEDAWLLLKKQVELLKDIGIRLIEKCDGLPLGVKVIGGLLRQKRIRQTDWQKVLDDSSWSIQQMPKELNYAVYLSYEDLQPCLKPCFLHYSLLPRGTLFYVDDIVGMWISEGFVHGTSHDLEEIGREYYDELIQRNLIEPDMKYLNQAVCNMHDVVRSFAHNVLGDEALIAHNSRIGIDQLKSQMFIRISLGSKQSKQHDLEWCSLQTQTSLRTLILVSNIKIKPGDSFLSLSSLRTLHLDNVNIDAIAESLYQLKHLRYLSVENSNITKLPEDIGKLKFLQYISLYGCQSLAKLPNSIGVLQDLRFLNLTGTNMSAIPRNFCGLTSLRKLYGFPACMDCDHYSLGELGPLSLLTELDIIFLENVASSSSATLAKLGEKKHLRYLSLCCTSRLGDDGLLVKEDEGISENAKRQIEEVFDELWPPLSLEHLTIVGYFGERLPRWMMSAAAVMPLWSLRILMMDDLACCTELPSGLSQLPCLELLQIRRAPAIKCVGLEFQQSNNQLSVVFPRLQNLWFEGMVEWEEWVWEEQVKGMPILEELILKLCKLTHVPLGLALHAKALTKLCIYDVKNLSSLENFTSVVHLDVFGNTDLERISNLPKLQKLVIVECPKLKVLEGMPALQRLNLEDYDMETVPRYLQDVNPRHLLLDCSLLLLTSIATGKSGPEWDKFSHIQQVKAYANDEGSPRKWYVIYTRDRFRFETNISGSAIAKARMKRTWLPYNKTCPVEGEWPVGQHMYAEKRVPLCVRFRCNAYRHLNWWFDEACLHCREADDIASPSDQWTEAAVYSACERINLPRGIVL